MNTPKVSVIVPVYNGEKYLKECLDSILGQSLKDIEIICVDAGSTDRSVDILNEYVRADSRLRVCSENGRLDAGTARNMGLAIAAGEYLAFLDSDDYFKTEMLEETYAKGKSENADIVVFYSQQLDMRTGIITDMPWSLEIKNCPKYSPFPPSAIAKKLFNSFQNWTWNKLFRADFIKKHNITFQSIARTNDMAFTCEALALSETISILPKIYTTYRIGTKTSLQQTNDLSPTCFWDAYKETRSRLVAGGVFEKYKQSFLNTTLSGAMYNLRSVKSNSAYHEIAYLLKYKAHELEFDNIRKSDIYSRYLYNDYRKLVATAVYYNAPVENPKVSVVLPCLNSREYIRECIESIMKQELADIEILVVDAGSTDGTLDVFEQYAAVDKRIRIIHSDKRSYGYQINLGLKEARGEYFAIVESDDYIKPCMYKDLCKIADKNQLEVLKADYCSFTGERSTRKFERKAIIRPINMYNRVLDPDTEPRVFSSYVVSWCGIYRTDFLKNNAIYHNESPGASFQDNGFWFQVFTQTHRLMFVDRVFYMLRRDNPGSSVFSASKAYCMFGEYDFIREFLQKKPELESRYAPLCAYKRFKNYLWANDNLVRAENRQEFFQKFSADFKKIQEEGEIDPDLFSSSEYNELQSIIHDPEEFSSRYEESAFVTHGCIGPMTMSAYIEWLGKENERLRRELDNKNRALKNRDRELQKIKHSVSYQIGRFITFLPRKTFGFVRCCRDHGLVYTLGYGSRKIGRFMRKIGNKSRGGIRCCFDHGIIYTVKYLFKKLFH